MSKRSKAPLVNQGLSAKWILSVSIVFVLVLTIAPSLQRYFAQRAQISALHSQITDARKSVEDAKKELAKWDDPEYVASQARTRLHFVFPGERQYAVIGLPENKKNSDAAAAAVSNQIPSGLPWYSRLVASISATNSESTNK
jgi:cell division protein FtsB